jgi:hypothetical protein
MADAYEKDPTIRVHPSDMDSDDAELVAIRAEIQQTRARMSHTVEDIGHRLNPDRLKEQLKQNVHEATIGKAENMARNAMDRVDDTRHNILGTIRDNPLPAAMVGIGLGWMLFNGRRSDRTEYYGYDYDQAFRPVQPGYYRPGLEEEQGTWNRTAERTSAAAGSLMDRGEDIAHTVRDRGEELAHKAQDRVADLAHDVRDTVSDAADRAQDAIGDTASRARSMARGAIREGRHTTHRIEDRIQNMLHDSPLAVGATVVALGLAAGLAAPTTRREAELMGPTRDRMLHQARERVSEVADKAQNVAGRVAREVEGTARRAVHEIEDTARDAAGEVQETARTAAKEEGLL